MLRLVVEQMCVRATALTVALSGCQPASAPTLAQGAAGSASPSASVSVDKPQPSAVALEGAATAGQNSRGDAASSSATALPSSAEPWCEQRVVSFGWRSETRSLRQAMGETTWISLAQLALDEPDCSGIGRHHLVFTTDDNEAAYVSGEIGAFPRLEAETYLIGGEFHPPRPLDLTKVCLSYTGEVQAEVVWILPLTAADVRLWQERIATRACGFTAPRCRGCSRGCSQGQTCCRWIEDSCPGPAGTHSTCAWPLPCDADCCSDSADGDSEAAAASAASTGWLEPRPNSR